MFAIHQDVSTEPIESRVLNTSHSALAYPAFLAGYRTVQEAMQDNNVNAYVRTVVSTTTRFNESSRQPVAVDDLLRLVSTTLEAGSLDQLRVDGASKLASYVLPVLLEGLQHGKDISSLAFLIATYSHYLQHGTDDMGEPYAIDEPLLSHDDWQKVTDGDSLSCLAISPFASAQLLNYPKFVAQYKAYRNQIACYGLVFSLKQTLCAFWEDESEMSGSAMA